MRNSKLVLNTAGAAVKSGESSPVIQSLTCNLIPSKCRLETLEGREHLVVPMVILTEGVHNGSNGPLYYGSDELGKFTESWDHKPVVVYHPEMNGQGISACHPDILNNRKVGLMLNTKFEKGRLKSEAWIEKPRAEVVDERIMDAINRNEMMELSTGVFVDTETTAGEFKGKAYKGIARNFRPDHLALLPDKIGACSIADGAGFLRNEKGEIEPWSGLKRVLQRLGLADNELSHSNICSALQDALRTKLIGASSATDLPYLWVTDVYSNFVVYDWQGKLFRLGYTPSETGVELSDAAPVEVKRVTEYRTVEGAFVGNRDQTEGNTEDMNKKEMISAIITMAAVSGWSESDRPKLEAFNDLQVKAIHDGAKAASAPPPAPATNAQAATPAPAPAAAPVIPFPAPAPAIIAPAQTATHNQQPQTLEQYINNAPSEIREVLQNGIQSHTAEKNRLIEVITKNARNVFTKEQLDHKPLGELRGLAALAAEPQTNADHSRGYADYSGMAPVATNTEVEEVMALPVMNFERPAAK